MRTLTPRRWPMGLFLIAILGLIAVSMPLSAGATVEEPLVRECPAGMELIAKFNVSENGSYTFEKPTGNEAVVVLTNQSSTGATWTSTMGVGLVIVKGGSGEGSLKNYWYSPPAFGPESFDNVGMANPGDNVPDISNVQFCGARPTPPTRVEVVKQWIGDADHDTDVVITLTARNAAGAVVDTKTCDYDDLVDGKCSIMVPAGGTYDVSETVGDGWSATGGIGAGFVPGQGPTCTAHPMCVECVTAEHCVTNEYEPPRPDLVEIEKAWIINSGGSMPTLPIDDFVTVQAYTAAQVAYGDPVVCDADASGKLNNMGWSCAVQVPEGGYYRVTENVPGGFAVTGANSGTFYEPGDSDFCVPRDNGVVLLSEMSVERYGHCVRNDDIPRTTTTAPPVTVPTEVGASVVLDKAVVGGPADLAGLEFTFTLTCGSTELPVTVGLEGDSGPVGSFPVGTVCEIEEGDLPTPPEGYEWEDVEALDVTLAASGENDVTFTNELTSVEGEEVVPPTEPTVAPTTVVAPEALPRTGGNGELTVTALAAVLVGMGLVLLARRREALS